MKLFNSVQSVFPKKITTSKVSTNPINTANAINFGMQPDTFVRTQKIQTAETLEPISADKKIKNLYNKTYDDVIKLSTYSNPILKDIKFVKPDIKTAELKDDSVAVYDPSTNSISINKNVFCGNLYAVTDTNEEKSYGIKDEKEARKITENNPDTKKIKLNDDEKELFLSSLIAHELRHAIQNQLSLSADGSGNTYKENLQETADERYKAFETFKMYNIKPEELKDMDLVNSTYDYEKYLSGEITGSRNFIKTYVPEKTLDENTKITRSAFGEKEGYYTIKDFIEDAQNSYYNEDGTYNYEKYLASARERDAYNFEAEYLVTKKDSTPDLRNGILIYMFGEADIRSGRH